MLNGIFYIWLISFVLGLLMVGIALLRINKMGKEHRKLSNDELLLEHEKLIQKKNIVILITGLKLQMISMLIIGSAFIFNMF